MLKHNLKVPQACGNMAHSFTQQAAAGTRENIFYSMASRSSIQHNTAATIPMSP